MRPHPALVELAADRPLPAVDDANRLLWSAREHRMQGLLWTRVAAGEIDLPRVEMRALAKDDLAVQAHHRRLWETLERVICRLEPAGLHVATAKGVAAEQRWYDRVGERPCTDIDLLLDPGAVDRIADVFALLHPDHPHRDRLPRLAQDGVLQSLDLLVDGVEIDLHIDLFKIEIPIRNTPTLWARTERIRTPNGITARAIDAELSLVHFLVHLTKDRFSQLIGYADIARLLRCPVDWDVIDRFVTDEGLRVHVLCALREVVERLELEPPPLRWPTGSRAALWSRLWPPDSRLRGETGAVTNVHRQFWIPWTTRGRLRDAVRWYIRRRVLPPPALVPIWYPDTSGPYIVRVVSGRWRRDKSRRELAKAPPVRADPRHEPVDVIGGRRS